MACSSMKRITACLIATLFCPLIDGQESKPPVSLKLVVDYEKILPHYPASVCLVVENVSTSSVLLPRDVVGGYTIRFERENKTMATVGSGQRDLGPSKPLSVPAGGRLVWSPPTTRTVQWLARIAAGEFRIVGETKFSIQGKDWSPVMSQTLVARIQAPDPAEEEFLKVLAAKTGKRLDENLFQYDTYEHIAEMPWCEYSKRYAISALGAPRSHMLHVARWPRGPHAQSKVDQKRVAVMAAYILRAGDDDSRRILLDIVPKPDDQTDWVQTLSTIPLAQFSPIHRKLGIPPSQEAFLVTVSGGDLVVVDRDWSVVKP